MRLLRVLVPLLLVGLAAPAAALTAVDTTGATYATDRVVVPILFPVVGKTSYTDTFLTCRSGCARKHMGQDLMGPKMSPLVAACSGTVRSVRRETRVGDGNYLVIACERGATAGWSAMYMHINNDTPGTDDGKGTARFAFPAGIAEGVQVLAGQLVAWRGDSGNAESTGPHLHFELHKGSGWGGITYNAYPSLKAARKLTAPTASGPHPDGTLLRSATGETWVVDEGRARRISPGVRAANVTTLARAITVSTTELRWYPPGPAMTIRDGALVKDPAGAVWRILGSTRFKAKGSHAFAVATADLAPFTVVPAPEVPLTTGVPLKLADGSVAVLGRDGRLHAVSPQVMTSWGWITADLVPVPLDLELPELGEPLGLRDGTLLEVAGAGPGVASGGAFRRLRDAREVSAYLYAGQTRLQVPLSAVNGLRIAEIAGR